MAVPALVYAALNAGGEGAHGWGIPMATDIAFAVGVLALFGSRIPSAARIFLLTLAIVDDLGAIAVIAVFYTDDLSPEWLIAAAALTALAVLMRLLNVWSPAVYLVIGVLLWVAMLESGVHATIAGVIMGLVIAARPSWTRPWPTTRPRSSPRTASPSRRPSASSGSPATPSRPRRGSSTSTTGSPPSSSCRCSRSRTRASRCPRTWSGLRSGPR
nr:hypothetical protein GCM10025732_11730 [Glycomyces mayteni]